MATLGVTAMLLTLASPVPAAAAGPPVVPDPDCTARVGYNLNQELPGYLTQDPGRGQVCVPFTQVPAAPTGYQGDYRVEHFTDGAIRQQLAACSTDPSCTNYDAIMNDVRNYTPAQFHQTGSIVPFGRVDGRASDVDLATIRRPGFFARAPYREPIAAADPATSTVEFQVPAEPYERINLGRTEPVRLRGWYLRGAGVTGPDQQRHRALVILVAGRTIETTAVQDPADPLYVDGGSAGFQQITYPARGTEKWGMLAWRQYLSTLNQAGFDVLTVDKRGHGISGGATADNTLQQGLDLLRMVDALRTGDGVRALGPDGRTTSGRTATSRMLAGADPARMPVLLGGPSQGAWATQWAMYANLTSWCSFDEPGQPCHRPWGLRNIRGAILLSTLFGVEFYDDPTTSTWSAASREVNHVVFLPSSEPLASVPSWPAVFIGKGAWDEFQGPLAAYDAYTRARGIRQLFVVRGPHSENELGARNVALMQDAVVNFARHAAFGRAVQQPAFRTLRDVVTASPPFWEPSSEPK